MTMNPRHPSLFGVETCTAVESIVEVSFFLTNIPNSAEVIMSTRDSNIIRLRREVVSMDSNHISLRIVMLYHPQEEGAPDHLMEDRIIIFFQISELVILRFPFRGSSAANRFGLVPIGHVIVPVDHLVWSHRIFVSNPTLSELQLTNGYECTTPEMVLMLVDQIDQVDSSSNQRNNAGTINPLHIGTITYSPFKREESKKNIFGTLLLPTLQGFSLAFHYNVTFLLRPKISLQLNRIGSNSASSSSSIIAPSASPHFHFSFANTFSDAVVVRDVYFLSTHPSTTTGTKLQRSPPIPSDTATSSWGNEEGQPPSSEDGDFLLFGFDNGVGVASHSTSGTTHVTCWMIVPRLHAVVARHSTGVVADLVINSSACSAALSGKQEADADGYLDISAEVVVVLANKEMFHRETYYVVTAQIPVEPSWKDPGGAASWDSSSSGDTDSPLSSMDLPLDPTTISSATSSYTASSIPSTSTLATQYLVVPPAGADLTVSLHGAFDLLTEEPTVSPRSSVLLASPPTSTSHWGTFSLAFSLQEEQGNHNKGV